jgi:hypothetical protein
MGLLYLLPLSFVRFVALGYVVTPADYLSVRQTLVFVLFVNDGYVRVCYVEICVWAGIEVLQKTVSVIAFTSFENVACDLNPGTWVFT